MHPLSKETNFSNGIKATSYFFNEHAKELFPESAFDSFHTDGSDLAICLHSIRDAAEVIVLLSSIEYNLPDFKGCIILSTDNRLSEQTINVEEYLKTSAVPVKILEQKENATVVDIKNTMAANVDNNWLLFIEPGMHFIKDPLAAIKTTIEELGVNFINLPIVNNENGSISSLGGALLANQNDNNTYLVSGSYFDFKPGVEFTEVNIQSPFLSDYLFSSSCVVNRKAFLQEGGFSNSSKNGLDDVELSFRIYKKGIKIGNVNDFVLGETKVSTNVPNPVRSDKDNSFNNQEIQNAIPGNITGNITYSEDIKEEIKGERQKKRIALIVDIKEWAFHNIAKNIETHLSDKYDFTIYFQADFKGDKWLDLFAVLYHEKFDMILCFWRLVLKQIFSYENKEYLINKFGISQEHYEQFLNETVLLTGVYDHLFLKPAEIKNNFDIFSNHVDGYFVSSHKLKKIYDQIEGYIKPYTVIQDGVDIENFKRKENMTFSDSSSPLVVGWAGNSKWGMQEDGIDHKGFDTIIKPAVAELIKEGYNITLVYADRHEPKTRIPKSQMNDFYNKLDVYICASDIEGTPNPVLESMACGIGIITTDVGIVKEVFGKEQRKFILEDRTKDCLKSKLITLINDKSILLKLAKENRIRISTWSWKSKCEKFENLFQYYFHKKDNKKLHFKKFPYETNIITEEINLASTGQKEVNLSIFNKIVQIEARESIGLQEELTYWKQNFTNTKNWYLKEYEVLPLWFKRLGHIIKVFQGHRKLRSLLPKSQNHK
ncbi:glycosyltransferase family 4 protein [Niastella populi]|nr:glycosyltransferase family 4 protein [Niastella populi]